MTPATARSAARPAALALMVAATLCSAGMGALAKSLPAAYPLAELVFARSAFALCALAAFVPSLGGARALRIHNPLGHAARAVYGILALALYLLSVRTLPFAQATVLGFATPFATALLSRAIIGERVGAAAWTAVAVGLAGVLVCVHPDSLSLSVGSAAALGGALFLGLSRLEIRRLSLTDSPFSITFHFSLVCALVSGIAALPVFVPPSAADAAVMVGLGGLGAASQVLVARAHEGAPAAVLGPLDYTNLLWAALVGYWAWGEVPTPQTLIGGAIIVAGGLLLTARVRAPVRRAALARRRAAR